MSRRVLLPPMPPNPTMAMFNVSLGAWNPRPSTCRGRMVTPAPTAVVVRNVRLDMSLMKPPRKASRSRQVREDRVIHDPNRRIFAHLDGVHTLVAKRLGVLDRRTQVPRGTDSRVHAAGVTRQQALDGIVQLLLVVEAGLTAEVEVGVAAAPERALPEDAPYVAETLRLRHVRWRSGRRRLATAARRRKPGAARLAGNLDALRRRVVL